ncbi:MAG TPA: GntR family transcriptional regulator [Acidimicrobiales bacterium]|nr:GntR family transcriptional regulator [Acidimicrobiales bacterium]
MAKLVRVERPRMDLAAQVYDRLMGALLEGALGPGDRLRQEELARELDVSRTPVRDALHRLHSQGVVEPAGRRGYVVRGLSAEEARQLYEARCAIEGFAAATAATLGGDAVGALRGALDRARARPTRTVRASFDLNRELHRAIVEVVGNQYLLEFFDRLWGRAMAGMAFRDFVVQHGETLAGDHDRLVAAIASGRPDEARDEAISHINRGLAGTVPERGRGAEGAG